MVVGRIQFHRGCWTEAYVTHWLLAGASLNFFPHGPFHRLVYNLAAVSRQFEQEKDQEREQYTSHSCLVAISKVASYSCFHILFIRSKWLGLAHNQEGGYCMSITPGCGSLDVLSEPADHRVLCRNLMPLPQPKSSQITQWVGLCGWHHSVPEIKKKWQLPYPYVASIL